MPRRLSILFNEIVDITILLVKDNSVLMNRKKCLNRIFIDERSTSGRFVNLHNMKNGGKHLVEMRDKFEVFRNTLELSVTLSEFINLLESFKSFPRSASLESYLESF